MIADFGFAHFGNNTRCLDVRNIEVEGFDC